MAESDAVWEQESDGSVTITLKPKGGHEVPWIVLRYKSVSDALEAFKKEDGAELMELFRNVSGAQKALDMTYNNKEAPPTRTQGKPEAANQPSPQTTEQADPFKVEDDAPPFATSEDVPTCAHGPRLMRLHGGKTYWVCSSDLPKDDPARCAVEIR